MRNESRHGRCPTGSWAWLGDAPKRILDIGTGSGIIALMLAQRSEHHATSLLGIDSDIRATSQAAENFLASKWSNRLRAENVSLQDLKPDKEKFDLVVSNPPYFSNLIPTNAQRKQARFTDHLSLDELLLHAKSNLSPLGHLNLILPFDQYAEAIRIADKLGFASTRITRVRSLPNKSFHRVLLCFQLNPAKPTCEESELTIELTHHVHSPEFKSLTQNFYLRYEQTPQSGGQPIS